MYETTTSPVTAIEHDGLLFVPAMTTAPVADVTLGRQNANDSDKSNYFEGS
ncbi:hypothetical protein ACFRKB_12075 [Streptomyces scopuliridis]|uniref:hypothetical protein n=1 Tax=Streptomyces scopuliridis TaxID=452529 RepID=UPI0036B63289